MHPEEQGFAAVVIIFALLVALYHALRYCTPLNEIGSIALIVACAFPYVIRVIRRENEKNQQLSAKWAQEAQEERAAMLAAARGATPKGNGPLKGCLKKPGSSPSYAAPEAEASPPAEGVRKRASRAAS